MLLPRLRATARILLAAPLFAALPLAAPASAQTAPATPPAGCTGPASNTWITIVTEGVRNAKGLIAVTVYPDNPHKFLIAGGSLYVGRVPAQEGTTRACIFLPSTGVWAIAVYHDEDGDTHFNRNSLGLPAEGYGFTNNASTLAGLPAFNDVRLNVARTGLVSHVKLKYP